MNVIFIYADDLGRGMLSCCGQKHFKTPNIDRICQNGLNFTNAHGCHICAPARASLLCGIHDAHCGQWEFTCAGIYHEYISGNLTLQQIESLILSTGIEERSGSRFLPMVFRDAGYVTGQIGKLDWGFSTTAAAVSHHGWDYHYGAYDHMMCHGYYMPFMFENGVQVNIPGNTDPHCGTQHYLPPTFEKNGDDAAMGRAVYSQDLYDEKIHEFLTVHKDEPFFLYHPSQLPHLVLSIPKIHPSLANSPDLLPAEKIYASMVIRLDETVGKILKDLDELGIADKTMVVFSSDNGHSAYYTSQRTGHSFKISPSGKTYDELLGRCTSETLSDVFDGNEGMTGMKCTNFEGGTRVPLMFFWPGKIRPGTTNRLVANYDFMATMADLLGTDPGSGKDGTSYLGTLLGRWEHDRIHPYIVYASERGPALLTRDGWKLRTYLKDHYKPRLFGNFWSEVRDQVIFELYYLPDDYREEHNLIRAYPEKARELQSWLIRECSGNLSNGTTQAHFTFFAYDHQNLITGEKEKENSK